MRFAEAYRNLVRPSSALEPSHSPDGLMPEHVLLHSVSVQIVLIHGFIKQDYGLKSAYLPFRNGITPLSASAVTTNLKF